VKVAQLFMLSNEDKNDYQPGQPELVICIYILLSRITDHNTSDIKYKCNYTD
jgi:hypothetical protein